MTELQAKLIEMMEWLHNFITSQGLRYYVYGGTALGAARHQGFIPWDDDIDIAMPRKDYEKLSELLAVPVDHYVMETTISPAKDFLYTYGKFYDTNTTMTEKCRVPVKRGVYIDIFPLDGIGNTMEEAIKNFKKIDYLSVLLNTRTCAYRKERVWYKNFAIFLGRLIPSFIINNKRLALKIDKLSKIRDFDEYQFFFLAMNGNRVEGLADKKILGNPTEIKFENISVMGPENMDEYLTYEYGDWHQLPPVEKRAHHDFFDIDYNKSYLQ